MSGKTSTDPAVKRSISLPSSLYAKVQKRMKRYGFASESAYFQLLARNDVIQGGSPKLVSEKKWR